MSGTHPKPDRASSRVVELQKMLDVMQDVLDILSETRNDFKLMENDESWHDRLAI